jgi:gamma-glutamyltranspeptidase
LSGDEARSARVVRGSYRGYEFIGTDAPAAGSTMIEILHILERLNLAAKTPAEWAAILAQMRLGFQDQNRDYGSSERAARIKVSKDGQQAGRPRSISPVSRPKDSRSCSNSRHLP